MNFKLLLASAAAVLVTAAAALVCASSAEAAGGRARLDFQEGGMSVAVVGGRPSYYLTYTLGNPMDEARTPRLHIEVKTDSGKTYGDFSDRRVNAAAERALGVSGLKSTAALRTEPLAAGASASCLANFGSVDPNADEMTVRVYGLWDPIVRTRQGKTLKENRVLVLSFARSGDEYDRPMDPIRFTGRKEEVEGEVVELYSSAK